MCAVWTSTIKLPMQPRLDQPWLIADHTLRLAMRLTCSKSPESPMLVRTFRASELYKETEIKVAG
jgi:hypothetical protein